MLERLVPPLGRQPPVFVKPLHSVYTYRAWARQVSYPHCSFSVHMSGIHLHLLRLELTTTNSDCLVGGTFEPAIVVVQRLFEPTLSETEFIAQVWSLVRAVVEHEAAEWFVYNGTRPVYPHK